VRAARLAPIRPPVRPNPRINIRAWIATGTLVPPPVVDDVRQHLPPAPVVLALLVGLLIGWGLR